jgi:hypothetical protein
MRDYDGGVHGGTLYVTHICDGEEVVRGGEDGQRYIATFANPRDANLFVGFAKNAGWLIYGQKPTPSPGGVPK